MLQEAYGRKIHSASTDQSIIRQGSRQSIGTTWKASEANGRMVHSEVTELISTLEDTNDEDGILNKNIEIHTSYTATDHESKLRSSSNHDVISVHNDDQKQDSGEKFKF